MSENAPPRSNAVLLDLVSRASAHSTRAPRPMGCARRGASRVARALAGFRAGGPRRSPAPARHRHHHPTAALRSLRATSSSSFAAAARPPGFDAPPPARPTRRVVITGIGLVTPLAANAPDSWARLLAGATGVRAIRAEDLPPRERDAAFEHLASKIAAVVPRRRGDANASAHSDAFFDEARWCDAGRLAPFVGYALCAASEALADASLDPRSLPPSALGRFGVSIGAGMGHVADLTDAGRAFERAPVGSLRRLSPRFVPRVLVNMAAGHVSMAHGLRGPNRACATACATGAHAVGDAFRAIQSGDADVMLAGGAEACVDAATIAGFARARALADPEAMFPGSTTRAEKGPPKTGSANDGEGSYRDADALASRSCRPFDADRGGFVIGEGAGVLVLETLEGAVERGAAVYGEIRGFGQAGDAHHVTLPPADGAGAAAAMRDALRDAGLEAEDVGYVNAHATGTRAGDAAEAEALRRVFGARFFARGRGGEEGGRGRDGGGRAAFDVDSDSDRLLTSSTKGATGHALGAAGAVEAAFAALAVAEGVVPPTLNLARVDPGMVAAAAEGGGGGGGGGGCPDFVPLAARRAPALRAAMTNSFGFGGTNASLVVAAPPPGVGAKRIGRGGEGRGGRGGEG